MSELDFENPHYCPVYDKVIDIDLCYETLMCLNRSFKISSVKELNDIEDIDNAPIYNYFRLSDMFSEFLVIQKEDGMFYFLYFLSHFLLN